MKLWPIFDTTVEEFGEPDQVFTTVSTRKIEGRIHIGAECPEPAEKSYFAYQGVAAAKYLYEVIKNVSLEWTCQVSRWKAGERGRRP